MLQTLIIIRCAIFALLALIIPVLYTQIHRLIHHEDFGAWQTGYIASLAVIALNYYILSYFAYNWIVYMLIVGDIIVCGLLDAFIRKHAITKNIGHTQTQQTLLSYITNKIIFLTTLYFGLGISQVSSATSSDAIEKIQEMFVLYEMYDISIEQYMNEIVLAHYNQIYQLSTLISLFVTLLVAYFATRWYMQVVFEMDTKYKFLYTTETIIMLHLYNLLVFSEHPPVNLIISFSFTYILSLILWWWFVDSEFDAQRELTKRHRQRKINR